VKEHFNAFIAIAHNGTWLSMKFEFCKTENVTMQNDECWVIFRNYTKTHMLLGWCLPFITTILKESIIFFDISKDQILDYDL
jgi:hypothetical protein